MKFNKSAMGLAALLLGAISCSVYGQESDDIISELLDGANEGIFSDVKKFVGQKKVDVNAKDDEGRTLLMYAAIYDNLDIVKYLVEHDADVNAKDNRDLTALVHAASEGNLPIVIYLVGHGADVNVKGTEGETALGYAFQGAGGPYSYYYKDIVEYLVDHGADVNAKDQDGVTALIDAAKRGRLEIVKYLVEQGADINAKNNKGETALTVAGTAEIKKYLEEKMKERRKAEEKKASEEKMKERRKAEEEKASEEKIQKLRSNARIVMEELTSQFSKGQKLSGPTFELWNKTTKPFWVSIGDPGFLPSVVIPAGVQPLKFDEVKPATVAEAKKKLKPIKLLRDNVDTSKPTILVVKDNPYTLKATIYVFKPGKTIYIARRPDGKIGPQTGPLKGLKGVTESGLSLKNNVKEGDIVITTVEVK